MPPALAAAISFTAPPRSIVPLRCEPLPGPAPAAKTTASAPLTALATSGVVGLFEVAHDGVAAGVADVVRVVGVADQRAHLVAALVEQPREPQRDLPVSSCDRHACRMVRPARTRSAAELR